MNENSVEKHKESELGYMHYPLGDKRNIHDTFTHLTGRLQMHPSYENTSPDDLDFRFKMLVDELARLGYEVSLDSAVGLHWWLVERKDEQMVEEAIEGIRKGPSANEQIATCTKLKEHAEWIAQQFDLLNKLTPLEVSLSQAYTAVTRTETSHQPPLSEVEEWSNFRDRLQADATVLAKIAEQARGEIERRDSEADTSTATWITASIVGLADRLSALIKGSQEKRTLVVCVIWNIYFPDNELDCEDLGAAIRRISRGRKQRKSQGH